LARAFERIADVLDEDRRRTETSADRRP
jgi:hypothetical protein